jgi:hypothetical protein
MPFDPKKVMQEQQHEQRSQSWLISKVHEFNQAHNRLKYTVHTAWRYPLPPWGRFLMGCFYFSIPVTVGYTLYSKNVMKVEETMKERLGVSGKHFHNSNMLVAFPSTWNIFVMCLPLSFYFIT